MSNEEFNLEVVLKPNVSKLKKAIKKLTGENLSKDTKDVTTGLNFDVNNLVNKITRHFDDKTKDLVSLIGSGRKTGVTGGTGVSTNLERNVKLLTSQMSKLTQVLSSKSKGTLGFDLELKGKQQEDFFRKFLTKNTGKIFAGLQQEQQAILLQAMTSLQRKQVGGRSFKETGKFVFERTLGTIKPSELTTPEKRESVIKKLGTLATEFDLNEKETDDIVKKLAEKQRKIEGKTETEVRDETDQRKKEITDLQNEIKELKELIKSGTGGQVLQLQSSVNLQQMEKLVKFLSEQITSTVKSQQLDEARPHMLRHMVGKQLWKQAANLYGPRAEKSFEGLVSSLGIEGGLESISDEHMEILTGKDLLTEHMGETGTKEEKDVMMKKLIYLQSIYKHEQPDKIKHLQLIQKLKDAVGKGSYPSHATMESILDIEKAAQPPFKKTNVVEEFMTEMKAITPTAKYIESLGKKVKTPTKKSEKNKPEEVIEEVIWGD